MIESDEIVKELAEAFDDDLSLVNFFNARLVARIRRTAYALKDGAIPPKEN